MTTGLRKPGEFCWINMLTPRPAEARAFFGKLLGWTYFEIAGLGHGMRVGGRDIGGLFDLDGPNTPPGTRADIGVMVKVDDADAVGEGDGPRRQGEAGVRHRGAGRMAVCRPQRRRVRRLGAEDDARHRRRHHDPRRPSWFETLTTDVARATEFYSDLFGWTPEVMPMPGFDYTIFKLGGTFVAGMMPITPEMGGVPPHWGTYFTVDDADEAARAAADSGPRICIPLKDIPGIGRFCGITSPQGVMFYAIQYVR